MYLNINNLLINIFVLNAVVVSMYSFTTYLPRKHNNINHIFALTKKKKLQM